jgi:hypothetical protein
MTNPIRKHEKSRYLDATVFRHNVSDVILQAVLRGSIDKKWLVFLVRGSLWYYKDTFTTESVVEEGLTLSFLSLSIVFGKTEIFEEYFEIFRKKYVNSMKSYSTKGVITNSLNTEKNIIAEYAKKLADEHKIQGLCNLLTLFKTCDNIREGIYEAIQYSSLDTTHFANLCYNQRMGYLPAPPVLFIGSLNVDKLDIPDLAQHAAFFSTIFKKLMLDVDEKTNYILIKWITAFPITFSHIIRVIAKPFMESLKLQKSTVRPIVFSLESDRIFHVGTDYKGRQHVETKMDGKVYNSFLSPGVDINMYTGKFIFMGQGLFVPKLAYHFPKTRGVVSRLCFGNSISNGVFISARQLAKDLDYTDDAIVDNVLDILCSPVFKKRKTLDIPYPKRCFLTKRDLSICAETFLDDLSDQEQTIFYAFVWAGIFLYSGNQTSITKVLLLLFDALITPLSLKDRVKIPSQQEQMWRSLCSTKVLTPLPSSMKAFCVWCDTLENPFIGLIYLYFHHTEASKEFLYLVQSSGRVLSPFMSSETLSNMGRIVGIAASKNTPSSLRRLAYQSICLTGSYQSLESWTQDFLQGELDIPDVPISIRLRPSYEDHFTLVFNREDRWIEPYTSAFLVIAEGYLSEDFEISIKNEEGMGQSVYEEVLRMLWKYVLENEIFYLATDADGNEGLCISPHTHCYNDLIVKQLAAISSLCVSRGLYLPFPISGDLWNIVYNAPDIDFDTEDLKDPNCKVPKYFGPYKILQNLSNEMSDQDFIINFSIEDDILDRETSIRQASVPVLECLDSFAQGWRLYNNYHFLCDVSPVDLNKMWCEPNRVSTTFEGFKSVLLQNEEKMDFIFLEYVEGLSVEDLKKLVKFVTGKERLPLLELGEDNISVVWKVGKHNLPTAQNCTNTLMVGDCVHSLQELVAYMIPIFNFETVFGFD